MHRPTSAPFARTATSTRSSGRSGIHAHPRSVPSPTPCRRPSTRTAPACEWDACKGASVGILLATELLRLALAASLLQGAGVRRIGADERDGHEQQQRV